MPPNVVASTGTDKAGVQIAPIPMASWCSRKSAVAELWKKRTTAPLSMCKRRPLGPMLKELLKTKSGVRLGVRHRGVVLSVECGCQGGWAADSAADLLFAVF
jgi:hypothetical protein